MTPRRWFAAACGLAVIAAILSSMLVQPSGQERLQALTDRIQIGMASADVDAVLHDSELAMEIQVEETARPDPIWFCNFHDRPGTRL
jgi:hypothetical protein